MTYDEAMNLADRGTLVRRAGWEPAVGVNYIVDYDVDTDEEVWAPTIWELDNEAGIQTGSCRGYVPSDDDRQSADWELYDPLMLFPEEDVEED